MKILLKPENSHPSVHDVYKWGQYNHAHRLQWSIKSKKIEHKRVTTHNRHPIQQG